MTHLSTKESMPTARITIKKSRVKHYKLQNETVYLQDGQEFEIELFNPTKNKILARIYINDVQTGNGLILRPAERVFLERYLNVDNKFKFETYKVSNTSESKKAIENNGVVRVEFFSEETYYQLFGSINQQSTTNTFVNTTGAYYNSSNPFTITTTNSTPNNFTVDTLNGTILTSYNQNLATKRSAKSKSIETGRIEMGDQSNQQLKYESARFRSIPFHNVLVKLEPFSKKINDSSTIKLKKYCTSCGANLKETWKFCSSCGNRI